MFDTRLVMLVVLLAVPFTAAATAAPLPFLRQSGHRFVDDSGRPAILRGCNLGNWLLIEMWMLPLERRTGVRDQYDMESVLAERFGEAERGRLMELYRENWITERDFELVRSFGMNCVRLPFNHRLLEDDDRPKELKPDAFKWLDRALDMAEEAGLYVILDMHGVPGGQSADHTTGQRGRNALWESAENRERTARLWQRIAERYRDRSVVAAYNMINEPYGSTVEQNTAVQEQVLAAIREVDRRHIILESGNLRYLDSLKDYGDPSAKGWENVGFTCNFYPGLFGQPACIESHQRFVRNEIPMFASYLEEVGVPLLVGEFNAVFQRVGGPLRMRRYCDLFAEQGWAATMWSYKIVSRRGGLGRDNWYMVTNAEEFPAVNFRTDSLSEIEEAFRTFGTMEYAVYEDLRAALTAADPPYARLDVLLREDALTPVPADVLGLPDGAGRGLRAEYFASTDMQGTPAFVRTDPGIDFDWGRDGPGGVLGPDGYSVCWTGVLKAPATGTLRIGVRSDDGARLWLGGDRLIDEWRGRPAETNTVFVDVEGGREYEVRLEYYQESGEAVVQLLWCPDALSP